jgi:hypothetical protein
MWATQVTPSLHLSIKFVITRMRVIYVYFFEQIGSPA